MTMYKKFSIQKPPGHKLTEEEKGRILHDFTVLKFHKDFKDKSEYSIMTLVSELNSCSIQTVQKTIESEGKYVDQRKFNMKQKSFLIDDKFKAIFEQEIKSCLKQVVRLTARDFKDILEENGVSASRKTIILTLNRWGLKFGRLEARDVRRQTQEILTWKMEYLKQLKENDEKPKEESYQRVYLDESYINANHSFMKGWHLPTHQGKFIFRPSGRGKRIVIIGAISEDGWLGTVQTKIEDNLISEKKDGTQCYGSIQFWIVDSTNHDYHGNFNSKTFLKYFNSRIIPNLKKRSLIIMDNARYHKIHGQDYMNPRQANKGWLKNYLDSNKIKYDPKALKSELLEKVLAVYKAPETELERIAREHGHRILFLPPYHPELSMIEYAWGRVKGEAAKLAPYNIRKMKDEILPKCFSIISREYCLKTMTHIKEEEDREIEYFDAHKIRRIILNESTQKYEITWTLPEIVEFNSDYDSVGSLSSSSKSENDISSMSD